MTIAQVHHAQFIMFTVTTYYRTTPPVHISAPQTVEYDRRTDLEGEHSVDVHGHVIVRVHAFIVLCTCTV
jgi:hypothetical protein